jgi:hypothetical protein
MQYSLVFSDPPAPGSGARDFGENVLFENLPAEYKVYAFYYPGDMADPALEQALRNLAETTGKNLFVNIGRLNDPQLDKIVTRFQVDHYPVIIVTADASLASAEGETVTAYARLDDKRLLKAPERAVECVRELFNLFLQGKVADAVARAKGRERAEMARAVGEFFLGALKPVAAFISNLELSFSLADGKITVKGTRSAGV